MLISSYLTKSFYWNMSITSWVRFTTKFVLYRYFPNIVKRVNLPKIGCQKFSLIWYFIFTPIIPLYANFYFIKTIYWNMCIRSWVKMTSKVYVREIFSKDSKTLDILKFINLSKIFINTTFYFMPIPLYVNICFTKTINWNLFIRSWVKTSRKFVLERYFPKTVKRPNS